MLKSRIRSRAARTGTQIMCAVLAAFLPLSTAFASVPDRAAAYAISGHTAAHKATDTETSKPTAAASAKPTVSSVKPSVTVTPKPSESAEAKPSATVTARPSASATVKPSVSAAPRPSGLSSVKPTATVAPGHSSTPSASASASASPSTGMDVSFIVGPGGAVSGSFVEVNVANFPDKAFRDYILAKTDGVTMLTQMHLRRITEILCPDMDISSLQGIRFFSRLAVLNAERNNLSSADLSSNPYLISVSLQDNPDLSSINLSGLTFLTSLNVCNTDLSSLDLSSCTALRELVFGLSPVQSIDLSTNTALRTLTYYGGSLSSIDLSALSELRHLTCASAPIGSVDLSANAALETISLKGLQLVTLDASQNPACTYLSAPNNELISVHGSPDASYRNANVGSQNPHTIAVAPADGSFDLADIDPKFAQGTVTNLSKGTLTGSVLSGIAPGDTVTYTYSDGGTAVDAVLNVTEGNEWTVPLSISGWSAGHTPNKPSAQSRYGTPVFTYGRAGSTFSSAEPTAAGTWICRAEVPGTSSYGPLTAEVPFEITSGAGAVKIPDNLTAVYREPVGSITLPAGFTWTYPSRLVGSVGRQMHSASYQENASSPVVTVEIPVTVTPRPGSKCRISPVTNEYEAKHIVITSGTYTLKEGTDYTLSYAVDGNTATITIHFEGNFTGTETRSFHFTHTNSWVVEPAIADWTAGSAPSSPSGAAKYGTVVFTYLIDGVYQATPPDTPGTYTMRASVAATDNYAGLTQDVRFHIYRGIAPDTDILNATYGDILSSVALPDGFTWLRPNQTVGNVGVHKFSAVYTPYGTGAQYMGGTVDVSVRVAPKEGSSCWISPVTNQYEGEHIVIRDGNTTLIKGTDYFVSHEIDGNTVTIHFIGNYTGTVTRTFTYQMDNEWIVPPSISSWAAGGQPSEPVGEARYGTVTFTYETAAGTALDSAPETAGRYILKAYVPASSSYSSLTESVAFIVYAGTAPSVSSLTATYGDTLSSVVLPDGFTWAKPDTTVGSVGTHSFAASYTPPASERNDYSGGSVLLDVRVFPKNGELLDISPVTNESDARNIVIMDGSKKLVKGTDYQVYVRMHSNVVTVTIKFIGNYCGSVVRTFTVSTTNKWIEPLSIDDWCMDSTPSKPKADSEYGTVTYTYIVNGHHQSIPPTAPGTYEVEAIVPATVWYPELTDTVPFTIYAAIAPEVDTLNAVYTDTLADIQLPDGFAWKNPDESCGDAGTHAFPAIYTPASGSKEYMGGTVQISIKVDPRDGALCTISPITNNYDARHIVITDNGTTLEKGTDYTVSSEVEGGDVTVTIKFKGNYYGTVVRSFTLHGNNEWIEPVTISSWTYGQSPSLPHAQAKYGTPSYTYLVDGTWQTERPRVPGSYTVRAVVAATPYYAEISGEASFTIYSPDVPEVSTLQAVYGDVLEDIELPDGFAWKSPETSVGNAGLHQFDAEYSPEGLTAVTDVPLSVRVLPKNGEDFSISPVTNMEQANHIVVKDDAVTLTEGRDYTVSVDMRGDETVVTIKFIGNYTGTVERTFTEAPSAIPTASPSQDAAVSPAQSDRPSPSASAAATVSPAEPASTESSTPSAIASPEQSASPINSAQPAPDYTASASEVPSTPPFTTAAPAPVSTETPGVIPDVPPADTSLQPTSAASEDPHIQVRPDAALRLKDEDGTETLLGSALVATLEGTSVQHALQMLDIGGTSDTSSFYLVMLDDRNIVMAPDDIVTTSCKVHLVRNSDGATVAEAVVVVLCDSLNTGRMNLSQLVHMAQAFTGRIELSGADLLAAALGDGDRVTLTDIVRGAELYRLENMNASAG